MKQQSWRPAFTLAEKLVVIGIIGVLASLVMEALQPQKNINSAHDATRKHDLRVLIDALYQYQIDQGTWPVVDTLETLDTNVRDVCSLTEPPYFFCTMEVPQRLALSPLIPDYLAELPHDPENQEQYETGYRLWLDADGRVHADAPLSVDANNLEISR